MFIGEQTTFQLSTTITYWFLDPLTAPFLEPALLAPIIVYFSIACSVCVGNA